MSIIVTVLDSALRRVGMKNSSLYTASRKLGKRRLLVFRAAGEVVAIS